jgi:hypothetical protein
MLMTNSGIILVCEVILMLENDKFICWVSNWRVQLRKKVLSLFGFIRVFGYADDEFEHLICGRCHLDALNWEFNLMSVKMHVLGLQKSFVTFFLFWGIWACWWRIRPLYWCAKSSWCLKLRYFICWVSNCMWSFGKKVLSIFGSFRVFGRADDEFNRQFKRGFKGKGEPPFRILPMKQAR